VRGWTTQRRQPHRTRHSFRRQPGCHSQSTTPAKMDFRTSVCGACNSLPVTSAQGRESRSPQEKAAADRDPPDGCPVRSTGTPTDGRFGSAADARSGQLPTAGFNSSCRSSVEADRLQLVFRRRLLSGGSAASGKNRIRLSGYGGLVEAAKACWKRNIKKNSQFSYEIT